MKEVSGVLKAQYKWL